MVYGPVHTNRSNKRWGFKNVLILPYSKKGPFRNITTKTIYLFLLKIITVFAFTNFFKWGFI